MIGSTQHIVGVCVNRIGTECSKPWILAMAAARDTLMTHQLLYSAFIGAGLATIGFIALTASLVPGFVRGRKRRRRYPALTLVGMFLMSSGIWLMYVIS